MPTLLMLRAAAMMLLFTSSSVMAEDGVRPTDPVPAQEIQLRGGGRTEAVQPSFSSFGSRIGQPIATDRLADMRGGADIIETTIDVDGTVDGNTASDVITGSNNIDGGSFANAAGLNTVIQNTGANVLIQNATSVQIEFGGPTP